MKIVVLDIEGTTTSIDFVHKVLFPNSYSEMDSYIEKHWQDESQSHLFQALKEELPEQDLSNPTAVAKLLKQWIDEDKKHPVLKKIQGYIWQKSYQAGAVKGHVYPDVLPTLKRWTESGIKVGIYSSGSVLAQKLIFGYSEVGDLTPYLSFHFDTQVGPKRSKDSYINIADQLNEVPENILFLSDIPEELEAAQQAGLNTCQIVREGTKAATGFTHAASLDQAL